MKLLPILILAVIVSACSGARHSNRSGDLLSPLVAPSATGPVSRACIASDRKARSGDLCGCIQVAANQTLGPNDQQLAASFYNDPQRAQDIRQSGRSKDAVFWEKYKNYSALAEAICAA
jgi:hypothetical protein